MSRKKYILLIVAVIFCVGCSSEVIPIRNDLKILEMKERTRALPYKVTVAPIRIMYDREDFNENMRTKEHAYIPEFDLVVEQQDLIGLFEEFGIFNSVEGVFADSSAVSVNSLKLAYDRGHDFMLELELETFKVSFAGFSGSYIANMVTWFLLTPPSWFIADEIYKSEVSFKVKFWDVYTKNILFEKVYRGIEKRALDDFERGWKLFGIFRVPGFLQVQNWEKISKLLTPFAMKAAKAQVLESLAEGDLNRLLTDSDFSSRTAKMIALCIGISKYNDQKIPSIKFAANDAVLVQEMLTDRIAGAGINSLFCRALKNQQASKEDIVQIVEQVAIPRARANDTFILYFSGYGYSTGTAGYLIPADCDYDRIKETAISMEELSALLSRLNAKSIIVFLDCSFNGTVRGRTLPGSQRTRGYEIFKPLLKDERVRLVLAAAMGENAYEFDSLQNGLFTYYLCHGVTEKSGDANLDGRIYAEEVYQYTKSNLKEISAYKGSRQNPLMLGVGDFNFMFHDPTRKYGKEPDALDEMLEEGIEGMEGDIDLEGEELDEEIEGVEEWGL